MEELETGTYSRKTDVTVTYWPAPDKDGDAEEVWEDRFDHNGNSLGRSLVKDQNDNEVFHYTPPDGFENRPSFDHTDNYVRVTNRGAVKRDIDGNAMGIRPGHALVEYPDGRTELLTDQYARHLFSKAHDKVSDDATSVHDTVPAKKAVPAKTATGGAK